MKALISATCIAVLAYIGWQFWADYQSNQALLSAQRAAIENAEFEQREARANECIEKRESMSEEQWAFCEGLIEIYEVTKRER